MTEIKVSKFVKEHAQKEMYISQQFIANSERHKKIYSKFPTETAALSEL